MYAPFRGGTNTLELFTTKEPYGVTTKVILFLELTCLQAGLSPPGYQHSESAAKLMQVSLWVGVGHATKADSIIIKFYCKINSNLQY